MADVSPKTDISTDLDNVDINKRTLRRLAQNREAARKSRLRKKAYVQQLESSRLNLHNLSRSSNEQESREFLYQALEIKPIQSVETYARWLEDQNQQINELRSAVNSHASDAELCIVVENIMERYDEIFRLKSNAAKADVFHLLSGMWKTPAEVFLVARWLPLIRDPEGENQGYTGLVYMLLVNQLEPLTDQQLSDLNSLQQSSQQAEDALSQGMEALQQSLAETLSSGSLTSAGSSGNVANYMGQMAMVMGKLVTLEGFIGQADSLRQRTLQQMHRILTTRQSARALLASHDYFYRLRALSSLWLARPRE